MHRTIAIPNRQLARRRRFNRSNNFAVPFAGNYITIAVRSLPEGHRLIRFCILPIVDGAQCLQYAELYWQDYTTFNEHAIEVWEIKDTGYFCLPDSKAKTRIQACICPYWAEGCSFYAKTESGIATKIQHRKSDCQASTPIPSPWGLFIRSISNCDPMPIQRELMRVQLYDDSIIMFLNLT